MLDYFTIPLKPGSVIDGKYVLLEEIGRGGMGVIFRAKDVKTGQLVALKTLHPKGANDPSNRKRFNREIEAISQLKSPYTVSVYDTGQVDCRLYYTMELLEGSSLLSMLRAIGGLTPEVVLRLVDQILQSLTEAHEYGIIHRDLTPPNIHLCPKPGATWDVRILDFGLVKRVGPGKRRTALTENNVAMGTLPYMAPEQLRSMEITPATDLYMVGHLLFEMLAGHNVYRKMRNAAIIEHKLGRLQMSCKDYPMRSPFGSVIVKALQLNPKRRYQSATQMREHLAIIAKMIPRPSQEVPRRRDTPVSFDDVPNTRTLTAEHPIPAPKHMTLPIPSHSQ